MYFWSTAIPDSDTGGGGGAYFCLWPPLCLRVRGCKEVTPRPIVLWTRDRGGTAGRGGGAFLQPVNNARSSCVDGNQW